MKTFLITTLAILTISITCKAQWTSATPNAYFNLFGNVGIGTNSPLYKLDLVKLSAGSALNLTGQALGTRNDAGIDFSAHNAVTVNYAKIGLQLSTATTGAETGGLTFSTINGGALSEKMFISGAGNVGIGTTTPGRPLDVNGFIQTNTGALFNNGKSWDLSSSGTSLLVNETGVGTRFAFTAGGNMGIGTVNPDAKLTVNGTLHTKEVKVDLTGWPDYVFEPAYQLPSLAVVRNYIAKNHHLPEMPSAEKIAKDGVNLGEIVKLQTKKIEELTLYLIEKDENEKKQQKQIDQLKKSLDNLIYKINK